MRNVPFQDIGHTAIRLITYLGPASDGSLVFNNEEYLARGVNRSFAHVPALITGGNDEGSHSVEPYSVIGTTANDVANTIVCSQGEAALWFSTTRANCGFLSTRSF